MKIKAYIILPVVVLLTLTTSCISREDFFDLANDIIDTELKISYPEGGPIVYFEEVELYSSKDITITIENSGDIELIITGIEVTGPASNEFSINFSQMPIVVEVGGITTFRVTFKPIVLGSRDALVTIVSKDSSDDKYSIQVNGIGSKPSGPVINVSLKKYDVSNMDAVDFGSIESGQTSLPARFVIENTGDDDLIIRDIFPVAGDIPDFNVDDMATSFTIGAGESSTFDVIFLPVSADGKYAIVEIESNALNTQYYSIGVSGNGLSITSPDINVIQQGSDPSLLGISGYESFNFGTVNSASPGTMIFSVQNTGTDQLTVSNILPSQPAFFISRSLDTAYISNGESATFEVTFNPDGKPVGEELTAVISIDSDDPDSFENPYTFEVRGTGTDDPVAKLKVHQDGSYITPDTGEYSFDPEEIGTPLPLTFTLENAGTDDLEVDQITSSNEDNFEITQVDGGDPSSNLPLTVVAGDSNTFVIAFTPTEVGSFSGVITIDSDDDPELSNGFVFNATGESIGLPEITVYENGEVFGFNTVIDFGVVAVGNTEGPVKFEIENTGIADLLIDLPIKTGTAYLNFILDTTGTDVVIPREERTSFLITFAPVEEGKFKNRSEILIVIVTNDPDTNPFQIRPSGEGIID